MKHVYTSIFTLALLAVSSHSFAQGPNNSGTYYQAADGKKGAELKTALCAIIRTGLENNVVNSNVVRDFANYLASTDKQIELNAEDMTNVLCEIVATEKSAYMDSQDAYKNKYPCLTSSGFLLAKLLSTPITKSLPKSFNPE